MIMASKHTISYKAVVMVSYEREREKESQSIEAVVPSRCMEQHHDSGKGGHSAI